jgi:hypothetical protein
VRDLFEYIFKKLTKNVSERWKQYSQWYNMFFYVICSLFNRYFYEKIKINHEFSPMRLFNKKTKNKADLFTKSRSYYLMNTYLEQ